jgi:WD40 repeat protein
MRVSVLSAVLQGHTAPLRAAVFSPDGQRVLTASNDRTARIWDARTGQPVAVLQGHTASVSAAVFSPDGARVLTTSDNGTARIWRVFLTTRALLMRRSRRCPAASPKGSASERFWSLSRCLGVSSWGSGLTRLQSGRSGCVTSGRTPARCCRTRQNGPLGERLGGNNEAHKRDPPESAPAPASPAWSTMVCPKPIRCPWR